MSGAPVVPSATSASPGRVGHRLPLGEAVILDVDRVGAVVDVSGGVVDGAERVLESAAGVDRAVDLGPDVRLVDVDANAEDDRPVVVHRRLRPGEVRHGAAGVDEDGARAR